ncbi:MAG: patatin-like phospholipase family protein [Pseudomonadota bacterium]|nr:patatin-like phospholipase family protein [Pseudomonadota bacterium]
MADAPQTVLLLQGGGALGAYQAGAFEALLQGHHAPDWVAGISIGAINAAIICGNPESRRIKRLKDFWDGVSSGYASQATFETALPRPAYTEFAAASVMAAGVPGFFAPRSIWDFWPTIGKGISVYRTDPLRETLLELVDFDYLNDQGPRISVGAVDVETGNFTYFDSADQRIAPEHIMASGALPPGFPPVEINGRLYWDGGLVSNTPLQYVFEAAGDTAMTIFQVDLFSAHGARPETLADVGQREKDIRYSSRTRLNTDRFKALHNIRAAADRLAARHPELADDPDLASLRAAGPSGPIELVHLIHRKEDFETSAKDYEFSRLSMRDHWAAGRKDVKRTLRHPSWTGRTPQADGLQIFDLTGADT